MLTYVPLTVYVHPCSSELGNVSDGVGPVGCIPVVPLTVRFQVEAPEKIPRLTTLNKKFTHGAAISRKGIPLGDGGAVTDYYAQGRCA